MQSAKILGLWVQLILVPSVPFAETSIEASNSIPPLKYAGDLVSPTTKVYRTPEVIELDVSKKIVLSERSLASDPSLKSLSRALEGMSSMEHRKGGVWPILLSALIPGAGEIYLGYYKRGAVIAAAEILAWTGYFYYHDKGLDGRDAYESYADENWSIDQWIDYHPDAYPLDLTFAQLDSIGKTKWGSGGWPAYHPWVDKEVDKQGYYEVIGKYDWFISGWGDFDPDEQPHQTDMRDKYRSMRKESNDDLKTADRFIYMSIGVRVFSIVETILLNRRSDDSQSGSVEFGEKLDLTVRPRGITSTEIAIEYRF